LGSYKKFVPNFGTHVSLFEMYVSLFEIHVPNFGTKTSPQRKDFL
jgi:hypothetical protein